MVSYSLGCKALGEKSINQFGELSFHGGFKLGANQLARGLTTS